MIKIEKSRDECAGLPEGKTASSRNVLASVSDQAVLFKKKKKKIWIPVIEMLSIPQNNGDGTETENDKVSGKQLHRSQSLHAEVCVSGLFPSLEKRQVLPQFSPLLTQKYPLNIIILHSTALGQHE